MHAKLRVLRRALPKVRVVRSDSFAMHEKGYYQQTHASLYVNCFYVALIHQLCYAFPDLLAALNK